MAEQSALARIEFTGEVPGPGAEILVTNDDVAEVRTTGTGLEVTTRAIADIAVLGFVVDGQRESGFTATWTSRLEPDSTPITVRLVGSPDSGHLRVVADDPAQPIRNGSGNRYFLRLAA